VRMLRVKHLKAAKNLMNKHDKRSRSGILKIVTSNGNKPSSKRD
jgi:hypothetical protein